MIEPQFGVLTTAAIALALLFALWPLVPEDASMYRAVQTEARRARRLLDQQP